MYLGVQMNIKWLIQSTGIKMSNALILVEALQSLNVEYNDLAIFENKILNLDEILKDDYIYITKGGITFLKMIENLKNNNLNISTLNEHLSQSIIKKSNLYIDKLINSIDYDMERFNQHYYSKLDLPLLNKEAQYIPYNEIKTLSFDNDYFIKPSKDLKSFNGGILNNGETLLNYIYRNGYMKAIEEETIILAPIKKIYSEYRFFMYKNEIISGSRYMLNNKVDVNKDIPTFMMEAARDYGKLYQPLDLYVMDLASTDNGVEIVEYNCWNASGFYESNINKIINTINEIKKN